MAILFNRKWNHFYARQKRGALDISDRLNILIETGRDAFGMEGGMISQIVDSCLTIEYSTQNDLLGIRLPLYYSYCDITLKINDVLATHDMNSSPFSHYQEQSSLQFQSYIGIPLWVNNSLYGTIAFTSSHVRETIFTERDKNFMRGIARNAERILG